MADENSSENTPKIRTANKVAESLSMLLGGSYSPEGLKGEDTDKALKDRLYHRLAAVEQRRQQNIEAIIRSAYEASEANPEGASETSLDEDWLARFIDFAQDIGNAEMQQVWGHILARETETPGTVSYQALEVLNNMVPADLDLVEKVVAIVFPTGYLMKIGGRNDFSEFGISAENIARLQSLDIIQEAEDLGVTFYAPTKGLTFDFKGADLIVRHPENTLITMPAFHLTSIGSELLPLLADLQTNMDYLAALGASMKSEGYDFRLRDSQGALIEIV